MGRSHDALDQTDRPGPLVLREDQKAPQALARMPCAGLRAFWGREFLGG